MHSTMKVAEVFSSHFLVSFVSPHQCRVQSTWSEEGERERERKYERWALPFSLFYWVHHATNIATCHWHTQVSVLTISPQNLISYWRWRELRHIWNTGWVKKELHFQKCLFLGQRGKLDEVRVVWTFAMVNLLGKQWTKNSWQLWLSHCLTIFSFFFALCLILALLIRVRRYRNDLCCVSHGCKE